jgi:heterodisulfide reductase subunit B
LSIRNISLAEQSGYKEILAPCPMCSQRLIISQKDVADDEELKKDVEDAIEMPCDGDVKIINYLELIKNYCMDEIAEKKKKAPKDLKIASYYGCLLLRPPKVLKFDDPENPTSMEEIVEATGATSVDWELKTNCCGGGFTLSRTDVVLKLTNDILECAADAGADAIAVACPMCHANLDMRQKKIGKEYKRKYDIPIVYISELIGLALDLGPISLGLNKHFIDTKSVVNAFA